MAEWKKKKSKESSKTLLEMKDRCADDQSCPAAELLAWRVRVCKVEPVL